METKTRPPDVTVCLRVQNLKTSYPEFVSNSNKELFFAIIPVTIVIFMATLARCEFETTKTFVSVERSEASNSSTHFWFTYRLSTKSKIST